MILQCIIQAIDRIKRHIKKTGDICKIFGTDRKTVKYQGYLKSLRGPKGGYQLSRDPKDYTIYEILKITEGSLQPVACLDDKVNQCERYHECPTIEIWEGLGQVIEEYLSGITLEDVVNKARIKGGNDYVI